MAAIPERYQDRPVYITETNQNDAWLDAPNEWIQTAYAEIDAWNQIPSKQTIRALILYRWPKYDRYYIEGKQHVISDFKLAQRHGYKWKENNMPGWEKVSFDGLEAPFHDQDGIGELTVPAGHLVMWDHSLDRPEMDAKRRPQPEVYEGQQSGVGFLPFKTFKWWTYTIDPITVRAGLRTYASAMLMIVSHGIDGDPSRAGACGMRCGISPATTSDPLSPDILWSDWWVVRGSLANERIWHEAETPEYIPNVGQVRFWIQCNADVAADISAGHWDNETIEQYTDDPEPEPGKCRALTADQIRQLVQEEVRKELDKTRLSSQ